jgi:hypothetical protein
VIVLTAPWHERDTRALVGRLRPLLDLPVEVVCPAHGAPTDGAALARALSL